MPTEVAAPDVVRVPGDKSLTQRALILASLAEGESRLSGLLWGGDAASTAGALRALGVSIPPLPPDGGEVRIRGVGLGGLKAPSTTLDLGNSGTGTRLLTGVLAGSGVTATLDGDDSLRSRPMARVTEPLTAMGAAFDFPGEPGRLPLVVRGRRPLSPIDWTSPVASAQVKSSILLAGLVGGAFALVTEPRRSRDHTERLFGAVGARVISHAAQGGWRVELRDPPSRIRPLDFRVPGDVSSAAFVLALAALGGAGDGVTVEDVGLNPTRTAFLGALERMGVSVSVEVTSPADAAEPVGRVTVRPSALRGIEVGGEDVAGLIDELPLLAILGARASGETRITGAAELRAKESDRIAATVANLRALGVDADELPDGMVVQGTGAQLSGRVDSRHDHRIAMGFAVLGASGNADVVIDDARVSDVSFPGFADLIGRLSGGGA
jgi:3-phosphoshikimate 1-carboxyvinyltransferase